MLSRRSGAGGAASLSGSQQVVVDLLRGVAAVAQEATNHVEFFADEPVSVSVVSPGCRCYTDCVCLLWEEGKRIFSRTRPRFVDLKKKIEKKNGVALRACTVSPGFQWLSASSERACRARSGTQSISSTSPSGEQHSEQQEQECRLAHEKSVYMFEKSRLRFVFFGGGNWLIAVALHLSSLHYLDCRVCCLAEIFSCFLQAGRHYCKHPFASRSSYSSAWW